MSPAITEFEMGLLQRVELYGDGLDLSGPHIQGAVKATARECLRKGLLTGKTKSLALSDTGRALLKQDRETVHPHA